MTDIVDPASLRPGDVARAEWDSCEGHWTFTGTVVALKNESVRLGGFTAAIDDRTWHLVSRAEPERGSVWAHPVLGEFYYEPDERWPHLSWVCRVTGSRLGLLDRMTQRITDLVTNPNHHRHCNVSIGTGWSCDCETLRMLNVPEYSPTHLDVKRSTLQHAITCIEQAIDSGRALPDTHLGLRRAIAILEWLRDGGQL